MKNYLEYKGFRGSVEYTQENGCLFGHVLGLQNTIASYEGESIPELEKDFHDAIEDYLYLRRKNGESLDPPAYKEVLCSCQANR